MKKLVFFLIIVLVILSGFSYLYIINKANYNNTKKENFKYDSYYNKEITGTELATVINRAIDNNMKYEIQKDSKGRYIANNENSINIDIKFTDDDNIHQMEIIYSNGIEKFVQFYGEIKFKCTKVEYHSATNKVKYLLFEQITE